MPFFAKGEGKDKLTLLYYTRASKLDITREQLYRAMVENDCMSFFDFSSALNELEEDGYVAAIPRSFGQGYRVTVRGENVLHLFEKQLPLSLRERLAAYADAYREPMHRETQFVTTMSEQENGSYSVELTARDNDAAVLNIRLMASSREMAKRIRGNWDGMAEGIYIDLMQRLLSRDAPNNEEDTAALEQDVPKEP